ncbi:MAG: tetratricopeptide repeat protein [Planctomycetes bacterium]|nr:tetratricopeptide repeat protein [Planctomycetota bacterium]
MKRFPSSSVLPALPNHIVPRLAWKILREAGTIPPGDAVSARTEPSAVRLSPGEDDFMPGCLRMLVAGAILIATPCAATAQELWHDRPKEYVPARPPTQKELDRREALNAYVLGLLCEREDRLLEAIQAYEKAARLDPEAAPVFKAMVPFYMAMERINEALAANRKVVELDPDDFEAWYMYARQLKALGRAKEAQVAVESGLKTRGIKDSPETLQALHFLLGNLREAAAEYQSAAESYQQAAKILDHPDAILDHLPLDKNVLAARGAEMYERSGNMSLKARRFDDAVASFRLAQKRHPDGAGRLNFNLAQVYREQGNLPLALNSLDGYLRLQPQGLEAYELKIELLQKAKRQGEILPWLEHAAQADAFNTGLRLLLARTHASLGSQESKMRAEKIYRELVAKAPSAEVYRGLFKLYQQEARVGMTRVLAQVDATLAKAKEGMPDPAQAQAMIAALREEPALSKEFVEAGFRQLKDGRKMSFGCLQLLALLADRNRQLDAAEAFLRQGLRQPPPDTEVMLYSGLLRVLWKANKPEEVLKVCQDGLRRSRVTHPVLFHSEQARALARLGKMEQALAEADKAYNLAADPDRFAMRQLKIRLLTMADKLDRAEAECQAILKEIRQPGEILETRYLLSNIYSAAKDYPRAEEQLGLVLKLDPSNATANNDLGYLWADQNKNLKQAEELIRKAIELDRQQRKKSAAAEIDADNPAYLDSLGWVLFRLGQTEAARRELERATALPDGSDPTIWDHLGDVYYRLRETDRARAAWQRALQLYEQENHRRMDARYKDVQRKMKLLDSARQP